MRFCCPASKSSSSSKAGRLRGAFTRPASMRRSAILAVPTRSSRPTSAPAPASSSKDNARRNLRKILEAVRDAGGTLVYVLGVGAASTAKRAEESPRRVSRRRRTSRCPSSSGTASHRVQPVADARACAAMPALSQRRRSCADHAAQRSGSRCDGQRSGTPEHPPPHQGDARFIGADSEASRGPRTFAW